MPHKTFFVTGATGFIGGQVARQLVQADHKVVAIARDPSKATGLSALGIRVVPGDITDKESLRAPMAGVDGIFHLAGWYQVGVVDESYRFDGPFLSEYDRTKWVAHYRVAEPMIQQGLPLIIVQPGGVYGPGDNSPQGQMFRQYLRRKLPMVPKGGRCAGHTSRTPPAGICWRWRGA